MGALGDPQKDTLDGMYDAEVAAQDMQVGHFLEQLKQAGCLENTYIVVCADHGEHLGEKQLIGHSLSIYNELVQVPLIIHDPNDTIERSTVREDVVSTRCLFHTVLSAAGLATSEEAEFSLEHQSTGKALEEIKPEHCIYAEAIPPQNVLNLIQKRQPELISQHACDQTRRAVWIGNHKLIETAQNPPELYDVQDDPSESLDLSEIFPEMVESLQDSLSVFSQDADKHRALYSQARATGFDDPEVRQRLIDLGYLEE
jgi:arylsulfatase A-like enzyme